MTNEREDKVRKVLEQAFKSNDTEFDMEYIEPKIVDAITKLLPLFPQPSTEEEVEKVVIKAMEEFNSLAMGEEVELPSKQKFIAKAISTHFCKPEISMEELERMIAEFMPHRDSQYIKPLALAIHKAMEGK